MATVPQAFELALRHHQAGRLAEAETLYRQILAVQPDHFDALHLLGVIGHQRGRHEAAVQLIRQAIAINPHNPVAHANLGEVWRALGRLDEAIASFRRAIELKPDSGTTHSNLGSALQERGRPDEAIVACRRALELQPDLAEAHNNLGNALRDRGQLEEAIAAYRRALELEPHFAKAHFNLGSAFQYRGQLEEAIAAYRRSIELNPAVPESHCNLAVALKDQGQIEEAFAACRRALELRPDFAKAHNNLGNIFKHRGQFEEAIAAYRRTIELQPDLAEAHNNLGNVLKDRGELDAAILAYQRSIELQPASAECHNNLGVAFQERGQLDLAIAAHRRALEVEPDYSDAHNNLGNAFKDQGQPGQAAAAYRRALELKPGQPIVQSNLIYVLLLHPQLAEQTAREETSRWSHRFGEPLKRFIGPFANDRQPDRRLRIGYVSPDFRDHVVGRNIVPLFKNHSPQDFELICYSGVAWPDKTTEEFRQRADQWRSTVGMTDEALAEMIRQDRVDVLVDLSQHSAGNRLMTFARQPAPVQVSFAGYPESTGVETIEYRISDRWLEKCGLPNAECGMTETDSKGDSAFCIPHSAFPPERVFLIDSFWCYDPCGMEVAVNEPPATANGHVTFGCLNNFCKVNEPLLRLWARVLRETAKARLVMLSEFGSHRQRTSEFLKHEGIEPNRVEFAGRCRRREYLELYHRLDMVLDTFPYNGHTTSLDALWMGAPVVSLAGETRVSRGGLSVLSNLGLPELVAHSEDEYVEIATRLARDLPRLAELRRTLRARMEASVLMDAPRFTRNIEAAYRAMWRRWCAATPS